MAVLNPMSPLGNFRKEVIPEGYTPIEYIANKTGLEYFLLDLYSSPNCEVEIAYKGEPLGESFGSAQDFNSYTNYSMIMKGGTTLYYGINSVGVRTAKSVGLIPDGINRVILSAIDKRLIINETLVTSVDVLATTCTNQLALLGFNRPVGRPTSSRSAIVEFSFKENRRLISHLLPFLDPYNVPCMYDLIRKITLYNQGTSEFIAGSPII